MSYSYDNRSAAAVPADFARAQKRQDELDTEYREAANALKALSGGGPFNLTPEAVRATREWQQAKQRSDAAFKALQDYNAVFVRRFKKELAEARRNRRR